MPGRVGRGLVNQTSLESAQGLGVPLHLANQPRSPPSYTEKKRVNINYNGSQKSISCPEDDRNVLPYTDGGRIAIVQPVSSGTSFPVSSDFSWKLPPPVRAVMSLERAVSIQSYCKSTQV